MKTESRQAFVVDDETNLRESLAELIAGEGFRVAHAGGGQEAIESLRSGAVTPDVVFLDVRTPRMDGLAVLREIQDEQLTTAPVIIISAYGDSSKIIEAMRLGAYDYITKPLDAGEIVATLHRAAEQRRLSQAAEAARPPRESNAEESEEPEGVPDLLGTSRAMREIFKQIGRLAATDATVLIGGDSGTGKELVARAIHNHSARSGKPFIAVNCGALPENLIEAELFGHERGAFTGAEQKKGRFELAHKGTLFLDEVGELTLAAQVKLLRALQERRFERVGGAESVTVDVRVIAATNKDLKQGIAKKRFREDLYNRLGVIEIRLPALHARLGDVPQLADHFLEQALLRHNLPPKVLSAEAIRSLLAYKFPGNVRELEKMIERAVVTAGAAVEVLTPAHLFGEGAEAIQPKARTDQTFLGLPFKDAISALERELILRALAASGGNRAEAARRLGIDRRLLDSRLDEYSIHSSPVDDDEA
jgi:two-component system response regulator AtoC